MQGLLTGVIANMRGETEVEHEPEGGTRGGTGGFEDRGPIVVSEPVTQAGMLGEEVLGGRPICPAAGADEPVNVSTVIRRTAAGEARRRVVLPGAHGEAQRGDAVFVACFRIRSPVEESDDDVRRGVRRRVGERIGCLPRGPGSEGHQQQPDRYRVVVEDGGANSPGSGHPGAVGEKQFQATVIAASYCLPDGLTDIGIGSRLKQDPGHARVVGLNGAFQGRARVPGSVVGVRARPRVEQETDHLGKSSRPRSVDLRPAGVAGVEQWRPAPSFVDGDRGRRVRSDHAGHLPGVAQYGGGRRAVARHVGDSVEDSGGLAQAPLDRGCHERLYLLLGADGAVFDGSLEAWPACESQFAGDDQLGCRQGDRGLGSAAMMPAEAFDSPGLLAANGVAQFFGLASQLDKVGAVGH